MAKAILNAQEFAKETNSDYSDVLELIRIGEIAAYREDGTRVYKIPYSEVERLKGGNSVSESGFVPIEKYEEVLRENAMLKTKISSIQNIVTAG